MIATLAAYPDLSGCKFRNEKMVNTIRLSKRSIKKHLGFTLPFTLETFLGSICMCLYVQEYIHLFSEYLIDTDSAK